MKNFEESFFFNVLAPLLFRSFRFIANLRLRIVFIWFVGALLWIGLIISASYILDYLVYNTMRYDHVWMINIHYSISLIRSISLFWGFWYMIKLSLLYINLSDLLPYWLNGATISCFIIGGVILFLQMSDFIYEEQSVGKSASEIIWAGFGVGVFVPALNRQIWHIRGLLEGV